MLADLPEPRGLAEITGLVLAGGRGSRLGGVDKGLQLLNGQPLVRHALQRLQPQVGRLAVNANRNLDSYALQGVPVWPDTWADQPGPLAGLLAGLRRCETPWLLTVPCDTPRFPADLAARMRDGLCKARHDRPAVATAATQEPGGRVASQPVFLLVHRSLADTVEAALRQREHRVGQWVRRQGGVEVVFDDPSAFFNLNTPEDFDACKREG